VQPRLARIARWWPPALAFAATVALELALVERKYGVLGGGFGASHVVDAPAELALFAAVLAAAQAVLIGGLWLGIRALHRRHRESPLFLLNFLFFSGGGLAALLVAKFEALSYFSDAMGFELVKSLGGGSLADALLFVASDAALGVVAALGAVAAWWLALRLAQRRLPERVRLPGLRWRHLLIAALPLPFLTAAAASEPDARYALARFTAPAAALALLHQASDFDRDGWSAFTPQRDSHPFDSARHPFVLDIPDNGIDEDGLGGDFHFAAGGEALATPALPADRKHLVIVVLESVRGDAIGKVVDGRAVTPVLNALARDGTHVRDAYSHVGFTTESLKSLFSGSLKPRVGAPSLFTDMKANGYRIGIFSGQPESFGDIDATVGMKTNADVFVDAETLKAERAFGFAAKGSLLIDGSKLLREMDRSFGSGWERPTFLYVNFQEAHFPYHHPGMPQILPGRPIPRGEISAANRAWVERTYWNAVAYDDRLVGELVARLKRLGVWEDTLLVVTADHGESLFDDAFLGHGHVINRQQTQIPLILSWKGVAVKRPIGLSDYRATILRTLGADVPAPAGPVFLHVSDLARPAAIGMVADAGLTTFQLETEEVRFGGTSRRYAELRPGSPERARADRLIQEWTRQRWIARERP
jgi:hypothetical protein